MKISVSPFGFVIAASALVCCGSAWAQCNSGSDGSDGAFNPTTNVVIDMTDHPTGIYKYSSVNIPDGVTVSFLPNANNSPVVWLVQSNCLVNGAVTLSGSAASGSIGGGCGPGGFSGGSYQNAGLGPGGGGAGATLSGNDYTVGGPGSFGSQGSLSGNTNWGTVGSIYGNIFLLPLLGGSGGGGSWTFGGGAGGGGGGGAILIAASGTVEVNGTITANGSNGGFVSGWGTIGGGGSGGGVRIVATTFKGAGSVSVSGGGGTRSGGSGRIRIDCISYQFGGSTVGVFTKGYQPIIIPVPGKGAQLAVVSVAGVAISATPSGQIGIPDAVIAGQQVNPVPVVVRCSNIPLNTPITVTVQPVGGATVTATGSNNSGTQASSTATVQMTIPRGGGLISATAVTAN